MKELSLSTISLEIFTNTLEHSEKKKKKEKHFKYNKAYVYRLQFTNASKEIRNHISDIKKGHGS